MFATRRLAQVVRDAGSQAVSSSPTKPGPVLRNHNTKPFIQRFLPRWSGAAAVNGEIVQMNSGQFKGKFLVMNFYPKDFTFVCPTELTALNDRLADFHALNAEVVGISVDSVESHLAWNALPKNQGGLGGVSYPLVADPTRKISYDYNVLLGKEQIALRGTYIIDAEQKVRSIIVNDLPVGRSVDEILRTIKAIQFADQHGEVCPANWNKGDKTIKPNTAESKEYFSTLE